LYPSSDVHLPPGQVRALFACSSPLPPPLAEELRRGQVPVNRGARGLIYDAKMGDLIRFLSVVRAYAAFRPPVRTAVSAEGGPLGPAELAGADRAAWGAGAPQQAPAAPAGETTAGGPSPGGEEIALVVLLLDRSAADPTAGRTVWHRLQDEANELLGRIGKRGGGKIDVAVVSYGAGPGGGPEVENTLAGRPVLGDAELAGAALRVEEVTEKVSNGIGGLVEITCKKPVYVDLPPTAAASPEPAVEAVAELIAAWTGEHPAAVVPPMVVHFTRGKFPPETLRQAAAKLSGAASAGAEPLLYHAVQTEVPHRSVAYPADPSRLDLPELVALWEISGPLVGREALAAERPAMSPESRGLVVGGRFDVLPDAIFKQSSRVTP
jgi:hypothetical protein